MPRFKKRVTTALKGSSSTSGSQRTAFRSFFTILSLKRICRREGRVSDFTAAELQNFDAGTWFNVRNPQKANEKFPAEKIPTAALFQPKINTILRGKSRLFEKAQSYSADELSLHYSLATQKMIEKAKEKGFPVTIWTADSAAWVKRALDLEIDAIITNNPARLLSKREEFSETSLKRFGTADK